MTCPDSVEASIVEWFRQRLIEELTCPRCDIIVSLTSSRCELCGMRPDEEGPPPGRIVRGILDL